MKKLIGTITMFEKHVLLNEDGKPVTDSNGKPKFVMTPRAVHHNGWVDLSKAYKNR